MRIRTIILKKHLPADNSSALQEFGEKHTKWIALGHVDEVLLLDKYDDGGFRAIQEQTQSIASQTHASHMHPVYLIVPSGKYNDEDKFWNFDNWWHIAIVRIHFSKFASPIKSFRDLESKIRRKLGETDDFESWCYYTTDLCDMVVVLKSTQLCSLVKKALLVQDLTGVGNTYTHIAMNHRKAMREEYPDPNDKLAMLSMRFSICGCDAKKIIEQAKRPPHVIDPGTMYRITGVDDVLISHTNFPVRALVSLFKTWLCDQESTRLIYKSIREVTTRVGDEDLEVPIHTGSDSQLMQWVEEEIQKYISELQISSRSFWEYNDWLLPAIELGKTLVRMSYTVVVDEVLSLLALGIAAFLNNVSHQLRQQVFDANSCQKCRSLVEGCSHVLEQLMRKENQLTSQFELRPTEYDIPVRLLEYILAFSDKIVGLFESLDKEGERREIRFLVVPQLCEEIYTQEVFRAIPKENRPGLVLLGLPVRQIYESKRVMRTLCHEIAHFSGEKCRCRKYRSDKLFLAAAHVFAAYLYSSANHKLIKTIHRTIEKSMMDSNAIGQGEHVYMENLQEELVLLGRKIVGFKVAEDSDNDNLYMQLLWDCAETLADGVVPEEERLRCVPFHERTKEWQNAERVIKTVCLLFREVYADLCMYKILALKPIEYLEALVDEWADGSSDNDFPYEVFAIRIYAVLFAYSNVDRNNLERVCECALYAIETLNSKPLWRDVANIVQYYCIRIDKKDEEMSCSFQLEIPEDCVYELRLYANRCTEELQKLTVEHLGKIKETYKNMSNGVEKYEVALEEIGNHRESWLSSVLHSK